MDTNMAGKSKHKGLRNLKNGAIWSSRGLMNTITNTLFVSYISFYATDVCGMSIGMIGTVLLITKFFDGVTDLIAGYIIDNTHTRWGKARPYDWCIPLIAIFTTLTFSAPKASQLVQAVYIGAMYVITQAVFGTLLAAADNIYLLHAFPEEKERNSVYTISLIVGQMIAIPISIVFPLLVAQAGKSHSAWSRMVLLCTVPLALLGMIRFFMIKEKDMDGSVNKEKGAKKVKNSVTMKESIQAITSNHYLLILTASIFIIVIAAGLLNTSAAYYFTYFVGDVAKMSVVTLASSASLISVFLFTPLANRYGKDKVMKLSLITATIGCLIRWIGGTSIITIGLGIALMMMGVMPISMFAPLYLFDIMDYSEWKTGTRVEGVLSVVPHFANKVAGGLAVSVGAFILSAAGYNGALDVQSETAMQAINMCFNVLPSILVAIMTLMIVRFYNIDKVLPQVQADLKERREQRKEVDNRINQTDSGLGGEHYEH